MLPAATQSKVSIVEATAEATTDALRCAGAIMSYSSGVLTQSCVPYVLILSRGAVEMSAVPDFIEGGGAAVSADPDLCPTSLVPEGIMAQLEREEGAGVGDSVEVAAK
jgi:hypothetical protein